jgi:uncharacterized membrane protein HdeD (DUF308 family)
MSTSYNLGENLSSEVKSRAGWGIFMGVLTAALGVLLMAYPLATATVTTVLLGCILVVVGVVELVQALRSHTAGSFFLRLLLGIVYGIGGVVLVLFPLWGVAVLTSVLGFMLLFEAIFATVLAFQTRPAAGWGWFLFDAGIALILAIMILAHWPASSFWAIGTLVGAAIFVRGITRIALSAGLRRATGRFEDLRGNRAA